VPRTLSSFSESCRRCARLAGYLDRIRVECPGYHARAVAPFGRNDARLLVVGLAPGKHGANRTGRPFTGDHAGRLLYESLHRYGFSSRPVSTSADDGLRLIDCRITNAVKCVPPDNRPLPLEIRTCNPYLAQELASLRKGAAILALGVVAHVAVLMALGLKRGEFAFAHGQTHRLPRGLTLYDSYHCSRYNTQTRRLTREGFQRVIAAIQKHLSSSDPSSSRSHRIKRGR